MEWTLCRDKQPSKEGVYLVSIIGSFVDGERIPFVSIGNWSCCQWFTNTFQNVYAWAELPKPAKQSEDMSISWYDFTHPNAEQIHRRDDIIDGLTFSCDGGKITADIEEINTDW